MGFLFILVSIKHMGLSYILLLSTIYFEDLFLAEKQNTWFSFILDIPLLLDWMLVFWKSSFFRIISSESIPAAAVAKLVVSPKFP